MSDEKQTHIPWEDGLPTKPEVDALLKSFPPELIKAGEWFVTDAEVRAVVGERCIGRRYDTVCRAWRKRLERDCRVLVYRRETEGFFCPKTIDVHSNTESKQTHAIRTLKKQEIHVAIAKPTSDMESTVQEHQLRLLHQSVKSLKKDRMNLLPSTESNQPPAIAPPTQKAKGCESHEFVPQNPKFRPGDDSCHECGLSELHKIHSACDA